MTTRLIVMLVLACFLTVGIFRVKAVLGKDTVRNPTTMPAPTGSPESPASPLDFKLKDIDGKDVSLSEYRGKVVMFVNVASRCGFTKQYDGLEALYKTYKDRGLVIIGIPADNFGHQEPGTDSEIKAFCSSKFNVTFPMMSKVSVKGDDINPLYKYLTEAPSAGEFAGDIGWNFTKFLVDRNGNVIARFASPTKPEDPTLTGAIEKALDAK